VLLRLKNMIDLIQNLLEEHTAVLVRLSIQEVFLIEIKNWPAAIFPARTSIFDSSEETIFRSTMG